MNRLSLRALEPKRPRPPSKSPTLGAKAFRLADHRLGTAEQALDKAPAQRLGMSLSGAGAQLQIGQTVLKYNRPKDVALIEGVDAALKGLDEYRGKFNGGGVPDAGPVLPKQLELYRHLARIAAARLGETK